MGQYLFVGERRSPTAIARGWTWESGRLCADTLHRALRAIGIDPAAQRFDNAFTDDGRVDTDTLMGIASCAVRGAIVVALGQKASRALDQHFIPHRRLTHPAARGSIRKRERYDAHVAEVLGERRAA